MSYLEGLGYIVYRIKEVNEIEEYLLYNKRTKEFNQYSNKRIKSILYKELIDLGVDWKEFSEQVLKLNEPVPLDKLISSWVDSEYILINNLDYKPVEEIIFKEGNKKLFNLYNKSELLKNSSKYNKGKFPNIKHILLNLVGNNEEEYIYFCKWLGWLVNHPLERLPTSIILQGEHGTGKTKFCELVLKNIFENNFAEIGQSDINKEFNDYIIGKQIIVANEVIHNDNKLLVPDKLKNYVTDTYVSINRKFKNTAYMRNYTQWIFVTNNFIPLKIEKGDRRYSIFKSKKLKNGFNIIDKLLNNLDSELKAFIYFLNNLEVEFKEVATPLNNQAKQELTKASQNGIDDFIDYIENDNGIQDSCYSCNIKQEDILLHKNGDTLISIKDFYKFYCYFSNENGATFKYTRCNFVRYLNNIGYLNKVAKTELDRSIRCIVLKGDYNETE